MDRFRQTDPPFFDIMRDVELLWVQKLGRFVRRQHSLIAQLYHLWSPLLCWIRGEDSRLDVAESISAAIIEHLGQPLGSLTACWGQVDLDHPRVHLLIQHNVEAIHFKSVQFLLKVLLHAFQSAPHDVSNLWEHVFFPCEFSEFRSAFLHERLKLG